MTPTLRLAASSLAALLAAAPLVAFAEGQTRAIDRGASTEDLLDVAKREKKMAPQVLFDAYKDLEFVVGEALKIEARTLDLPLGQMTLAGGWLIPIKAKEVEAKLLEGKPAGWLPERPVIAMVYIGDGSFSWDAPNPTEQWALNEALRDLRVEKDPNRDGLKGTIDGGAVIHLNGRWRQLLTEGGKAGTADKKTLADAKKLWAARGDLQGIDYARRQTRDALEGEERGFLGLEMQTKSLKGTPFLTYDYDPDEFEGVSLSVLKRYALNRDSLNGWSLGQWVAPEKAAGRSDRELGHAATTWEVDVSHYNQDMTVYRDPDVGEWGMQVEGSLDLKFNEGPHKTLRLALMNKGETDRRVTVERLEDENGNTLEFLHHGDELIISLPAAKQKGDSMVLKYKYKGLFVATIKQEVATGSISDADTNPYSSIINYRVPNDYSWYPQVPGHMDSYSFDWVLRVPKPMVAATSGMLLSVVDDGTYNVHTIKEDVPVSFPAILFGRLSVKENNPDYSKGETKIRVYIHPGFEKDAQSFIDEAQSILNYYSAVFGPYPYKELDLAQMPGFFGYAQAPAGLVQMTGEVYMSKTDLANLYGATAELRDYFIPHEIAHEWWGHRAGWGSYRDQWVSETFAEFSAALYVEERDRRKSGDPNDTSGYDQRAADWKRQRRGHIASRTSPLWMGGRSNKYQSTVYARGPLVLDALRRSFGREAVLKMMFTYNNYAHDHGGNAITDDLQLVLEQVIPGVGFADFIKQFIKLNAELPGTSGKDDASADPG